MFLPSVSAVGKNSWWNTKDCLWNTAIYRTEAYLWKLSTKTSTFCFCDQLATILWRHILEVTLRRPEVPISQDLIGATDYTAECRPDFSLALQLDKERSRSTLGLMHGLCNVHCAIESRHRGFHTPQSPGRSVSWNDSGQVVSHTHTCVYYQAIKFGQRALILCRYETNRI